MKRHQKFAALVSALALATGTTLPASAALSPADDDADTTAFEEALSKGSMTQLRKFLAEHPTSQHASDALEEVLQLAQGQGSPGFLDLPGGLPPGLQGRDSLPPGIESLIY